MSDAALDAALLEEEFKAILDNEFPEDKIPVEGSVVRGKVVSLDNKQAVIDIGYKVEGRVPLGEFEPDSEDGKVHVSDFVMVYIERVDDPVSGAVFSRDRARREERWGDLEVAHHKGERVEGTIVGRVRGGFTVDLGPSVVAFLPGSQLDVRPVRDVDHLMRTPLQFQILKIDRKRGNLVVSRRSILEKSRAEQRDEAINKLEEGAIIEGAVKNITDYGAFVDLGGIDGLLHVTDISWHRIHHPTEAIKIGQTVKVIILKMNKNTQRISLGMKQLQPDPWESADERYVPGMKLKGWVTNTVDYGAFVELELGIEGLVHLSEMSWVKKNLHPSKIVSESQEVEVMVLGIDVAKRRFSLSLKQCTENPWKVFAETHTVGEVIQGPVRNITDFGLFIGLPGEIDGMVHLSDLSWDSSAEAELSKYSKGQMIQASILDIDHEKERVSLGVKQLDTPPQHDMLKKFKKGDTYTCIVSMVYDDRVEGEIDGIKAVVRKSDLSRDRSEQRTERFAPGDKIDAQVSFVEMASMKVFLSVKALEIEEEKKAVAQYGSSDSGASLGDILGVAISQSDSHGNRFSTLGESSSEGGDSTSPTDDKS